MISPGRLSKRWQDVPCRGAGASKLCRGERSGGGRAFGAAELWSRRAHRLTIGVLLAYMVVLMRVALHGEDVNILGTNGDTLSY